MTHLRRQFPSAVTIVALALTGVLGIAVAGAGAVAGHGGVAGAGAAAGHGRKVARGFLGVVADGPALDGSVPLASQTPRMARAGLETLGATFNWADLQPYASATDVPTSQRRDYALVGGVPTSFRATDAIVLAASRAGMGVFPIVVGAPAWARLEPDKPFSPPADPAGYGGFLRLLIRRYGPAGSFWAAHPGLPARPIRAWQIWNEPAGGLTPNSPSVFWDAPQPFQPRYVALLHAAHDAIKAADPGAQVVLAGLVGRSWETLQTLYDSGAAPYFDTVALHPYTGIARNVIVILRRVRAVMSRGGDAAKPLVITELGWPSFDGAAVSKLGEHQRQQAQGAWLQSALQTLIAARQELRLRQILVYTWVTRDASGTYAFDYAGLLRVLPDGHLLPKAALAIVARIAGRIEGRQVGR